tara:strand:- start:85 stop:1059 length:975 start_codon:yes stop_codon:yes gene_type:complete
MKNILSVAFALAFSLSAYSQSDVYLKINHLLGASPFAFNTTVSNNLGNNFDINRMEYYISSISITHDGGAVTSISDTWILANASTPVNELLGNYNIATLESISFSIGVETPTNHNDPSLLAASSPLSPKSPSMHWGWSAGYRFVAMEGMAGFTSTNQVFQLHGLGDVNYFSQTIITAGKSDANGLVVELNADYEQAVKSINVASGIISHGDINEAKNMLENFRDNVFTATETTVAVNEITKVDNHFKMYPNPKRNGEALTFKYDGNLINPTIEVMDLSGRVIAIQKLDNSNQFIFNELDKGVYFVNLKSTNGEVTNTEKLIVTE